MLFTKNLSPKSKIISAEFPLLILSKIKFLFKTSSKLKPKILEILLFWLIKNYRLNITFKN